MPVLVPKPAATVMLVRDTARGMEVLMLQRNFESAFVPGVHVFPGGTLDEEDESPALQAQCDGPDDAAASRVLGVARGGLAFWIAAIRELFEEAGVLLARDAGGELISLADAAQAARMRRARKDAESGALTFGAMVAAEGLRLAADRLTYFSRWITPEGAVRRYDTRFFYAARAGASVGGARQPRGDRARVGAPGRYSRAPCSAASASCARPPVTRWTVSRDSHTVAALIAAVQPVQAVAAITPRVARSGQVVVPGEPGYEEAASAEGRGEWKP